MRSHRHARLLILPITVSTGGFGGFAIIQYFKYALGLRSDVGIVCRQIEQGFLPVFRRSDRAYQDNVVYGGQHAGVYLVRNKTACPESPEQVVQMSALFCIVGEYIAKSTATIGFLDELAGKQITFLQRFRRQDIKADFSHAPG